MEQKGVMQATVLPKHLQHLMEQKGVMQATVLPTPTAPNGAERCDAGNSFANTYST